MVAPNENRVEIALNGNPSVDIEAGYKDRFPLAEGQEAVSIQMWVTDYETGKMIEENLYLPIPEEALEPTAA